MHLKLTPLSLIILSLVAASFSACGGGNRDVKNLVTAELEAISDIKRSYGSDKLDRVFEEIIETRPDIEQVMEEFDEQNSEYESILQALGEDPTGSEDYYSSALAHAHSLPDSNIGKTLAQQLSQSRDQWHASLTERNRMVERVNAGQSALVTQVQKLKIEITLAYMQDLQAKNKPILDPAKSLLARQASLSDKVAKLPRK